MKLSSHILLAASAALGVSACQLLTACGPGSADTRTHLPHRAVNNHTAINPYTLATHSLRGPVSSVVTETYEVCTGGPDRHLTSEYKRYDPQGRLTGQSVAVGDLSGDTIVVEYDMQGYMIPSPDGSVTVTYDSNGCLARIDTRRPSSAGTDDAVSIAYVYDRAGRLVNEAMGPMYASSTEQWGSVVEYEYGAYGLTSVLRRDTRRGAAVMTIDSTGAPVDERVYDLDNRPVRQSCYTVTGRDSCGNWTDVRLVISFPSDQCASRRLHRHIKYHR